jgi:hypothetical protein
LTEISLHILDIAHNSIAANATLVEISVEENVKNDTLTFIITDNGKKFEVPAEQYGLSENDIVELTADKSGVKTIEKNDAERDERLTKNKERLRSLFKNKK